MAGRVGEEGDALGVECWSQTLPRLPSALTCECLAWRGRTLWGRWAMCTASDVRFVAAKGDIRAWATS